MRSAPSAETISQSEGIVAPDGRVTSKFFKREDMTMLYEDLVTVTQGTDENGYVQDRVEHRRGKAIGYVHQPSGTLFTLKGNFSLEWNQTDGPAGLVRRHANKSHQAREAAAVLLNEDLE